MFYKYQLLFSDDNYYDVSLSGILVESCLTPFFSCPGQSSHGGHPWYPATHGRCTGHAVSFLPEGLQCRFQPSGVRGKHMHHHVPRTSLVKYIPFGCALLVYIENCSCRPLKAGLNAMVSTINGLQPVTTVERQITWSNHNTSNIGISTCRI